MLIGGRGGGGKTVVVLFPSHILVDNPVQSCGVLKYLIFM
jgi:hypothetical protein